MSVVTPLFYCVYYCCQCCRFPAAVTRLQGSCQEMVCGGWCVYRLCQRQVTKQTCADRQMVDLCACLLECDKSYTRTPCTLRPLYVARVRLATIVTEVSIAFILRKSADFWCGDEAEDLRNFYSPRPAVPPIVEVDTSVTACTQFHYVCVCLSVCVSMCQCVCVCTHIHTHTHTHTHTGGRDAIHAVRRHRTQQQRHERGQQGPSGL